MIKPDTFYVIEQRDKVNRTWAIATVSQKAERFVAAYPDQADAQVALIAWTESKHIGTSFLAQMGQEYRIRKVVLPGWTGRGVKVKKA